MILLGTNCRAYPVTRLPSKIHIPEMMSDPFVTTHKMPRQYGVTATKGDTINPIIDHLAQWCVYRLAKKK